MFTDLSEGYRRAFKRGFKGWDVAVLQLNLRGAGHAVGVDGDFGPQTEKAVREYQEQHRLEADGIAGIRTCMSIMLVLSTAAQNQYNTPGGLLRGLMEGESGWSIAATTPRYGNGSRDVGGYQENLSAEELRGESTVASSFLVSSAADRSARRLRTEKNQFFKAAAIDSHEEAWRCAVLNHNWPAAASRVANGTIDSWVYNADFYSNLGISDQGRFVRQKSPGVEVRAYRMGQAAQWIKRIGVPYVYTGYQWAKHYVDTKVIYVRGYTE